MADDQVKTALLAKIQRLEAAIRARRVQLGWIQPGWIKADYPTHLLDTHLPKTSKVLKTTPHDDLPHHLGFLDLPPEIRNVVYEYAGLTQPESESVCIDAQWTSSGPCVRALFDYEVYEHGRRFGIALTCKQIAAETLPMLYSSCFEFGTLTQLHNFLDAIGESCKYLRRLRVLALQSGEAPWAIGQGRPFCRKLVSFAPNLEEFTIVLDFDGLGASKKFAEPTIRAVVRDTEPLVSAKVNVMTDIASKDPGRSNMLIMKGTPVDFWRSAVRKGS